MNANGEKMILDKKLYDNYVKILENELVPALGCTEPIAIAYAAAKAREILGAISGSCGNAMQRQYYQECKECYRTEYGAA